MVQAVYIMVHHLQVKEAQAMNIQQHIQEQVQVVHINTEMQHTKQAVGTAITFTLCIRTTLSSVVEVTIVTMLPLQGYLTSLAAIGNDDYACSFRVALCVE